MHLGPTNGSRRDRRHAFTLIELLVVAGILGSLLAVLLPGLARARSQARTSLCASNLRQVVLANGMYADESGGMYCPGAADFLRNLHRWHGTRRTRQGPFDPARGPLAPYLGEDHSIRACSAFVPDRPGFEAGNGGYGYNNAFIGVQTVGDGPGEYAVVSDLAGAYRDRVARPADTLMFADAALASGGLIEYSFAEPRFHPQYGSRADPSIHFRHHRAANVAWCDAHVSPHIRTFSWSSGFYEGDPADYAIGWFGRTDDNGLFDLR